MASWVARDSLDQFAVGRQRPMHVGVGAQDVRQGHRINVVGLLARDAVALAITSHRHRVDRVDPPPGLAQVGDPQATRGLDRHRDRIGR